MSLKERLRGIVAAVATAALAFSVAPVTAMAATGGAWTGQDTQTGAITIEGEGIDPSSVTAYRVGTYELENNVATLTPVTGLEDEVRDWMAEGGNTATNAAAIAKAVTDNNVSAANLTWSASAEPVGVTTQAPMGLYLIQIKNTETTAYQNIVVALSPAAKTNPEDGTWVTGSAQVDVKSSSTTLEKTATAVNKADGTEHVYEVGDKIDYTVKFSVGANMATFYLDDTMSECLTFDKSSLKIVAGQTTLINETDYNVYTGTDELKHEGATFTVVLTTSGIAKIAENGGSATMTYTAELSKLPALADGIDNTIKSEVNDKGTTSDLNLVQVGVHKYANGDSYENGDKLTGAVFGLYSDKDCTEAGKIAEAKTQNGEAVFDVLLDPSQTYYVKEISAPAGYELDPVAKPVTFDQSKYGAVSFVEVKNTALNEDDGFNLPSTGGPGTIALTVAGAGLVAGAAYLVIRSRKEN